MTTPPARLREAALPVTTVEREEVFRITLCGSTRFRAEYELWNRRLSMAGFLVYSVSCFGHSGDPLTDEEKARLDMVHLAKIDASHAIVVINPGGYIGESTAREIKHAQDAGKPVYYLSHGRTVYQLRTGPDGVCSLRYRAFDYEPALTDSAPAPGAGAREALKRAGYQREMDITQALMGPHEWGYRDPVEGGFTVDHTPFMAAEFITHLRAAAMLAPPAPEPKPGLGGVTAEEIARVIEPVSWEVFDRYPAAGSRSPEVDYSREDSLRKARSILALIASRTGARP